jgi:type IV pilus assembly protein PilO
MEVNPTIQARLDQIAKLSSTVRAGIAASIVVLLGAGYFTMMYQDASENLERLRVKELELQRKLSEVRSIAANIDEFEEEIKVLELKLQKVLRQLPNDKEIEVLLTDISNLGKTSGIEMKSFQRREEVVHGFYAEVPIDLVIEGEYHDIARFFDMLANLPRIVNMGSLSAKVASESLEATVLKVSGTATTFRFVGKGESA